MDAGPTVLAALKDAGESSDDIDFVLLSHLHGDHFGGIPFMIMEYLYDCPRQRELVIAGPQGTEERVRELFRAMYKEASARGTTFPVRYVTLVADCSLTLGAAGGTASARRAGAGSGRLRRSVRALAVSV